MTNRATTTNRAATSRRNARASGGRAGRFNRTGVFLGTLVLILAALFTPGWVGVGLLVLLAVGVVGLLVATWPAHTPANRARRVTMVVIILTIMVVAALHKVH